MKISLFKGIFIGVFGAGALIGLFVFSTYNGKNNSPSAAIGSVVVWGVLPKADMASALVTISKADKSLAGVSYAEHDPLRFKDDLATAIATGRGPDLLLISQEQLLSLGDLIQVIPDASLPARTFSSSFVGEAQLFRTASGSYGVPFLIDPLVMYQNRTILSSNGIATPPTTWEAMTGLVSKITTLTSAGRITRALIALGTYDNTYDARGILSALFLQTGVPLSVVGTGGSHKVSLSTGDAVLRFYTQFADPTKVSYTWNASLPNSRQAFLTGDLVLYLGYASEAGFLRASNPNLDFDVSPFPQPATATNKSTYGLVYGFALTRGSKNAGGAFKVATLLTGATAQTLASSATGLAPASLSVLGGGTSDPILTVAYRSALYAKGWLSPAPADTDQVFSGMINSVTSGKADLRAALSTAERSLNAAF